MTSSGNSESLAPEQLAAADVVAWLKANPDVFEQFPDALATLELPHASGGAVSLVERQMKVLREDNRRLQQQLQRLVTTARQNEQLNRNIHALVLGLMNAVGPAAIFARLEQCLREDFGADHIAIRVFAATTAVDAADLPQFVGAAAAEREPFARLCEAGDTRCGTLDDARHEALFNAVSGRLSAVMMPLGGASWDGVLVIASNDAERYDADMGTEFLTYLKDVVALVIDPWVRREA